MSRPQNAADFKPGEPKAKGYDKLLQPNAHDAKEVQNATNALEQAVGKSGKPSGPLGKAGREF